MEMLYVIKYQCEPRFFSIGIHFPGTIHQSDYAKEK